ncbi:23S rRNA (pseudouridine(1915)-N(3))-methyltransferase RlmH [Camelimonas abortus]|uniref:Ribosomal RNA large subunit methyltransferase H n=1 Tax=Camelimonas abortus TaxID=1017184 RepID=A0ABV7LFF8_9HYPH
MKISLVCVGRMKAGPERELAERYQRRAAAQGRALGVSAVEVAELPESRAADPARRKAEEAAAILARVGDAPLFAFDERGAALSSAAVAGRLDRVRESGAGQLCLVIGGADGLDASVRGRAQLVLSFGAMTLPHQLVRVLALEQVYRLLTIIGGHPYHRA